MLIISPFYDFVNLFCKQSLRFCNKYYILIILFVKFNLYLPKNSIINYAGDANRPYKLTLKFCRNYGVYYSSFIRRQGIALLTKTPIGAQNDVYGS